MSILGFHWGGEVQEIRHKQEGIPSLNLLQLSSFLIFLTLWVLSIAKKEKSTFSSRYLKPWMLKNGPSFFWMGEWANEKYRKKNVSRVWEDKINCVQTWYMKKKVCREVSWAVKNFSFKTEIKSESNKLKKGEKISTWVLQSGHFITLKQIIN